MRQNGMNRIDRSEKVYVELVLCVRGIRKFNGAGYPETRTAYENIDSSLFFNYGIYRGGNTVFVRNVG